MKRAFLIAAALVLMYAVPVAAAPPGDSRDPDVGKKLASFNLIAVPHDWATNKGDPCFNNGSRIFIDGNATLAWWLYPGHTPDFEITDCNGTDGNASIDLNETQAFWVTLRVLGPHNASLGVYCHEVVNAGSDDLCIVEDAWVTYNRSKDFTKIMFNVFDNATENVLWTLDPGTRFKIAQVWIFEKI